MLTEKTVLKLFDSYWFQHEIFTSKPNLLDQDPKLHRVVTTPMRKSHSDQFLSSKDKDSSESPKIPQLLQTILSGKEIETFEYSKPIRKQEPKRSTNAQIDKRRKRSSESLTDLEFEELRGFMDLGFVFSDEEKEDSRLVSIIPGLLRLGKNINIDHDINVEEKLDKGLISRPYLSEAWDTLGHEKRINMKNWRIPDFGNEIELKDHLRCWAHSVAYIYSCMKYS